MHDSDFLTAWLRLAFTPKVGPRTFVKLLKKFNTPNCVLDNLIEVKRRYNLNLLPPTISSIEDEIATCYNFGGCIILTIDDLYPKLLKEIEGYPPVLFVKGNVELLKRDKIAIVGTRNASINGEKITKQIAGDLGKNGFVVVSGLARGIDAAAHYGSLDYGTIGVIASGIDRYYPKENEKLQQMLSEKGLIVSENQMHTEAISKNFPRRNRIISGMSIGVLVTEAMQRSGTMITANYALEQGREVFAIPGSPIDQRAYGTNTLIKNGAILVRDVNDILSELHVNYVQEQKTIQLEDVQSELPIISLEDVLLNKLSHIGTDIDELFAHIGGSVAQFNHMLIELELLEKIVRQGNKIFLK